MTATIVDFDVLRQVVVAAFAAGIGITAVFGIVIYGSTRFVDMRRAGNLPGAALFGALAVLGLLAFALAVGMGLKIMTDK